MVSLTSSLRGQLVKCFTTLLLNTLIFFVEKMREAFALQKLRTFFQQKNWHISDISIQNFKETLTNDVISFEQPGPGKKLGLKLSKQSRFATVKNINCISP